MAIPEGEGRRLPPPSYPSPYNSTEASMTEEKEKESSFFLNSPFFRSRNINLILLSFPTSSAGVTSLPLLAATLTSSLVLVISSLCFLLLFLPLSLPWCSKNAAERLLSKLTVFVNRRRPGLLAATLGRISLFIYLCVYAAVNMYSVSVSTHWKQVFLTLEGHTHRKARTLSSSRFLYILSWQYRFYFSPKR